MAISLRIKTGSVLGTFSKGYKALSLNFGPSGCGNCDTSCPMHPKQSGKGVYKCYARRVERRPDRDLLLKKLWRNYRKDPETLCLDAIEDVERRTNTPPEWFRFSSFGSVPNASTARLNKRFRKALRMLVSVLNARRIPIHFPIETARKASYYRRLLKGLNVVVRESAATKRRFLSAPGAIAFVGGDRDMTMLERVIASKELAALRTEKTGRKCVVCPAVISSFKRMAAVRQGRDADTVKAVKCGQCTSCSKADVDTVYPMH